MDNNIMGLIKLLGIFFKIFLIIIPFVIIVFGIFDLYKAVVNQGDKSLNKSIVKLVYRVIAGLLIFFLPSLVFLVFKTVGYEKNDYVNCFLDVSTCKSSDNKTINNTDNNSGNNDNLKCTVENESCISNEIYIGV